MIQKEINFLKVEYFTQDLVSISLLKDKLL